MNGHPALALLLRLVAAITFLAPASAQATEPTRVLFVGNSLTYFNNLPEMVSALSAAGGHVLETRMIAPGGWTLRQHFEGEALRALHEGRWDFVVLQEQSTLGTNLYVDGLARVGGDEVFRPWAEKWAAEVTACGARPVFYLTWARRKTPEDQATLNAAVLRAANAAHAEVAPAGPAWALARTHRPGVELYFTDGAHPGAAGSYLAACTLYATLFHASPVGLPGKVSGTPLDLDTEELRTGETAVLVDLGAEDARALQEAAWAAVQALPQEREHPGEPAGARLPPLPRGASLTEKALAGTWSGSLALSPTGPADLELYLEPPTSRSAPWVGYVHLAFHSRDVADVQVDFEDLAVGAEELTFSIPKLVFDLDARFRAVLPADGGLRGHAEAGGAEGSARLLGSFVLRRKAD